MYQWQQFMKTDSYDTNSHYIDIIDYKYRGKYVINQEYMLQDFLQQG